MILIGLVDDHITTRAGLKSLLERNPRSKVSLEASSGKELLTKLSKETHPPQIVLLDINMPEMNGVVTIKEMRVKYPSIKIIVFSMLAEEDIVINMINHGACGFLTKSTDPSELIEAILSVAQIGYYIGDTGKKEYYTQTRKTKTKSGFAGKVFLSEKELEFMKLSASNLTLKEISYTMKVSPKTVENYRDSLFQKLDINNRAALILYGIRNGLIPIFEKTPPSKSKSQ